MKEILGQITPGLKYADLHVHTKASDGLLSPEQVVVMAREANLAAVAVTDHNEVAAAKDAQDFARNTGNDIEVIIGSEISTTNGHLIAIYIEGPVKPRQSALRTIHQIHDLDGSVIIPHPFFRRIHTSLGKETLLTIIGSLKEPETLDGFEVFNLGVEERNQQRAENPKDNSKAVFFYEKFGRLLGAAIASSDNHRYTIGRARTGYVGDLKECILSAQTIPVVLNLEEQRRIIDRAVKIFGQEAVLPPKLIQRYQRVIRDLTSG